MAALLKVAESLSPMRRFYKFVVKRLLGPYIKYDLDLDQLDVKLGEGMVQLHDLELNTEAVNWMLDRADCNMHIASGVVDYLCITIPWRKMMTKSCRLDVRGVKITIASGRSNSTGLSDDEYTQQRMDDDTGSDNTRAQDDLEGVQVLERWIEGVMSRLQVTLQDLEIELENEGLGQHRLSILIPHLAYRDTTSEDKSVHEMEGMASVVGRPKKEIKLRQLTLQLSDDSGNTSTLMHSGGSLMNDRDDYIAVTCPPLAAPVDGPQQYDVFIGMQAVNVVISPQQLNVIVQVLQPWLQDSAEPAFAHSPTASMVYGHGLDRLETSLEPGDIRAIDDMLNKHEGVTVKELQASSQMASFASDISEEDSMFYSTLVCTPPSSPGSASIRAAFESEPPAAAVDDGSTFSQEGADSSTGKGRRSSADLDHSEPVQIVIKVNIEKSSLCLLCDTHSDAQRRNMEDIASDHFAMEFKLAVRASLADDFHMDAKLSPVNLSYNQLSTFEDGSSQWNRHLILHFEPGSESMASMLMGTHVHVVFSPTDKSPRPSDSTEDTKKSLSVMIQPFVLNVDTSTLDRALWTLSGLQMASQKAARRQDASSSSSKSPGSLTFEVVASHGQLNFVVPTQQNSLKVSLKGFRTIGDLSAAASSAALEVSQMRIALHNEEDALPHLLSDMNSASGSCVALEIRLRDNKTAVSMLTAEPTERFDADKQEEFRASAVAKSDVLLHFHVPEATIMFTNRTLAAVTDLINAFSLSSTSPTANEASESSASFVLVADCPALRLALKEDQAPSVALTNALPDHIPAEYIISASAFRVLHAKADWLDQQHLLLTVDGLLLEEARVGKGSRTILRPAPAFATEFGRTGSQVASVWAAFGELDNQVDICGSEMAWFYHVGSLWLFRVIAFFAGEPSTSSDLHSQHAARESGSLTKLSMRLHNTVVYHQPVLLPQCAMLHLQTVDVLCNIFSGSPDICVNIAASSAVAYLVYDGHASKSMWNLTSEEADVLTLHEYLYSCGFSRMATVEEIEADVTTTETPRPQIEVNVRNPHLTNVTITTCADSFQKLLELVNHLSFANDVGGYKVPDVQPSSMSGSGMMESALFNYLGEIDPEAFLLEDAPPASASQATSTQYAAESLPFVIDDFYDERGVRRDAGAWSTHLSRQGVQKKSGASSQANAAAAGWVDQFRVYDDYFTAHDEDEEALREMGALSSLPDGYPDFAVKASFLNLNIVFEMYGGFDWPDADQVQDDIATSCFPQAGDISGGSMPGDAAATAASASKSNGVPVHENHFASTPRPGTTRQVSAFGRDESVLLKFVLQDITIRYWEFAPRQENSWRLVAVVNDTEIRDCLAKSSWKKFLTRSRRFGELHGQRPMVMVELDAVHPNLGMLVEDWKLKLRFVPLKLNIDQDALEFLTAFFSYSPVQASSAVAEEMPIFFQKFELSTLHLCIDYKAKHLDLERLRAGNYEELANLLSLEGMEVELCSVNLTGVSGWPDVGAGIVASWAPNIWESQLHRYAAGVQPFRSLSNIASGMYDLVYLPLYDERSVLRGIQRGTRSCAWKVTLELVSVTTRMAIMAQIALEHVHDAVGPEDGRRGLVSKKANAPSSIQDGLQQAYRSLSRRLQLAASTAVGRPVGRSANFRPMRSKGYVNTLLRGVLGVGIGATEAASKVLLGVQHGLDPASYQEGQEKYKEK